MGIEDTFIDTIQFKDRIAILPIYRPDGTAAQIQGS